MLYGLVGGRNASGRFVTHFDTRFLAPSFDGVAHDESSFRRSVDGDLAGRSLDEIAARRHGEDGCFPDVLCGFEQTCFQNHLEVLVSADRFQFADLVEALLIVALQELTHAQHDVDFRSTGFDSHRGLCHFDLQESLRSREASADAGDIEFRVLQRLAHILRHRGIDADSCYIRDARKIFLEIIDRIGHFLHFRDGVVGGKGGVVDLVETLFPNLHIIVIGKMFCFDFCYLSLHLLIGKRAGVLRK